MGVNLRILDEISSKPFQVPMYLRRLLNLLASK